MKIHEDYSLKELNSLKVDARAKYYAEVRSVDDIMSIYKREEFKDIKKFILGGGNNLLFLKDFDGLVINVGLKGVNVIKEDDDHVFVELGSGEDWHEFVTWSVERGLGGVENMALIPGKLGAAPIQNIAAYGQNLSDVFVSLDAVDLETLEEREFDNEACRFTYRSSIFKEEYNGKYLITKVRLSLNKKPDIHTEYWSHKHGAIETELEKFAKKPYTVKDIYTAVTNLRTAKFPDLNKYGTAGSFFKNALVTKEQLASIDKIVPGIQYYPLFQLQYPKNVDPEEVKEKYVKVAVGQLMDDGLNMRGVWEGKVGIWKNHGLVLVTKDSPKPDEVVEFVENLKQKFRDKFGIELEREVRYIE